MPTLTLIIVTLQGWLKHQKPRAKQRLAFGCSCNIPTRRICFTFCPTGRGQELAGRGEPVPPCLHTPAGTSGFGYELRAAFKGKCSPPCKAAGTRQPRAARTPAAPRLDRGSLVSTYVTAKIKFS